MPAIVGVRERRHLPFFVPSWFSSGELFLRSAFMPDEVICLVLWKGIVVGCTLVQQLRTPIDGNDYCLSRDSMFVGLTASHLDRMFDRTPGLQIWEPDGQPTTSAPAPGWVKASDSRRHYWRERVLHPQVCSLFGENKDWGDLLDREAGLKWKKLRSKFSRPGWLARRADESPYAEPVAPDVNFCSYRVPGHPAQSRPRDRRWQQQRPVSGVPVELFAKKIEEKGK